MLLSADLADPVDGQLIQPMVLNRRAFIDVTFADASGGGLNVESITGSDAEFTLGGAAVSGVVVDGAATWVAGSTYRYTFTGSFGLGRVTVDFVEGFLADEAGNLNAAETEEFTVGIPELSIDDKSDSGPAASELADRVRRAGFVCGYDPAIHDRFFDFQGDPVPNPDFIFAHHDLSGIAWRLNYRNLPVLISPQHFIFASHVGIRLNTAIRFMNRHGEVKSFLTVELFPIPGSDLKIGKLDRPVTFEDEIAYYPILSYIAEAHAGREVLFFKKEMQGGRSWTTGLVLTNGVPRSVQVNPHFLPGEGASDGAFAVAGDSGNPSFVEYEGRLALVGIHTDDGVDQLVSPFVDEINAILADDGFALGTIMDQEIVVGANSLFFGDEVLDGQPPFSLVGETVSQQREIVLHNSTTSDKTVWLATSHPFFRPDSASVVVPAEGSASVGVNFESDGYGEHAGILLVEGEGTMTSIALLGRHTLESFTRLDDFLPEENNTDCVWGDYDRDGDVDVVCARPASANGTSHLETVIYRNDEQESFVEISPALPGLTGPYVWGDYDRDGDLDLVVTGAAGRGIAGGLPETRVYRNDGDDVFAKLDAEIQGVTDGRVAWVDHDADGDLDLHIAGRAGAVLDRSAPLISQLYVNEASGQFIESGISFLPLRTPDLSWGDYDNDGDPDLLAVGRDNDWVQRSIIYRNDRDGEFHELQDSLGGLTSTSGWADFDHDGDLDVLPSGYATLSTPIDLVNATIYLNAGDGTFQEIETDLPLATGGVHWGDYDVDGDLDAFVWGQITDHGCSVLVTRIYRYEGEGTFVDIDAPLLRTVWVNSLIGGHVTWDDYEGDGDLDLLMDGLVYRNNALDNDPPPTDQGPTISVQAGDANRDFLFDQLDIISVLQTSKYLTAQPATWSEGDWNGDRRFDQADIVAALQSDTYLRGRYVTTEDDADTTLAEGDSDGLDIPTLDDHFGTLDDEILNRGADG